MGLPAYSSYFKYVLGHEDPASEADDLTDALISLHRWSVEIGAVWEPRFDDPVALRGQQALLNKMFDENTLRSKLVRWLKKKPELDQAAAVQSILKANSI